MRRGKTSAIAKYLIAAQRHRAVLIRHPGGDNVPIDAEIAPLIRVMWRRWTTYNSCQDNFGYVWVEMAPCCAKEFLALVAGCAGDARIQRCAGRPTPLNCRVPADLRLPPRNRDEWLIGSFTYDPHFQSIRFPRHHLAAVTAAVKAYCRTDGASMGRPRPRHASNHSSAI